MEEEQKRLLELTEKGKLIELKPVQSSNVAGIGYDAENCLLKVAFKNKTGTGAIYLYEAVDQATYDELISAESIGKKLNESIVRQKEKFKFIRL